MLLLVILSGAKMVLLRNSSVLFSMLRKGLLEALSKKIILLQVGTREKQCQGGALKAGG